MCVLMIVASGFPSREIAHLLHIPKTTVDNDVSWWQMRLHAQNRSQLSALSVSAGLLRESDLAFDGTIEEVRAFLASRFSNANDPLVVAAGQRGNRIAIWRSDPSH